MEIKCDNPDCENLIEHNSRRIYCCDKCNDHCYYMRNRKKIISDSMRWQKNNPEKYKNIHIKAMKKFVKTDKFRKSIMKNYYNNKDKWASRKETRRLLKLGVIVLKNNCQHIDNLEIHHETYPTRKADIIQAVKENKIYYLCRKCHREIK